MHIGDVIALFRLAVQLAAYVLAFRLMTRLSRQALLGAVGLTAAYLLTGYGSLRVVAAITGQHYDYYDVMFDGELPPMDETFLTTHLGLAGCVSAMYVAWFASWNRFRAGLLIAVPIVGEVLVRLGRWVSFMMYGWTEEPLAVIAANLGPALCATLCTAVVAAWLRGRGLGQSAA